MRKRYEQIMDEVEVTGEMRERILSNIAEADICFIPYRKAHFLRYRKYLAAAACLTALLLGAISMPGLFNRIQPGVKPTSPVQEIPDIRKCASREELSVLVGFTVEEPAALPFEAEETVYTAYWKELAQITYSGEGQSATYRMSAGTEDNSGDYNVYSLAEEYVVGGNKVTLKGNDGSYSLALWTDGEFSYSVKLSTGVTGEALLEAVPGYTQSRGSESTNLAP